MCKGVIIATGGCNC